jgi:hypothetical protein
MHRGHAIPDLVGQYFVGSGADSHDDAVDIGDNTMRFLTSIEPILMGLNKRFSFFTVT